jgi:hypothetical protein
MQRPYFIYIYILFVCMYYDVTLLMKTESVLETWICSNHPMLLFARENTIEFCGHETF